MRAYSFFPALALGLFFSSSACAFDLEAHIWLSNQTIHILERGIEIAVWDVSTARAPFKTRPGIYQPLLLQKMHYSSFFKPGAMPWSVFFDKGEAIHGAPGSEAAHLGTRASHGCVRVATENAERFFHLVEKYGKENTRIIIDAYDQ